MSDNKLLIEPIAYIKNGYNEKFGVPRQSGLVDSVKSEILFRKGYRDETMFRGIEQYSHLWLVWGFSENHGKWSPTVRPPKLTPSMEMSALVISHSTLTLKSLKTVPASSTST